MTYELWTDHEVEQTQLMTKEAPKYRDLFQNFLVIDKESGLALFSYSNEVTALDEGLISGFLSAMDSFVSELGGSASLKEISYKGFFIQAAYGKDIKMALFLNKPGDKVLKERLEFFIKEFEEKYKESIEKFRLSGEVGPFYNNPELISLLKKTLDI